MPQGSREGRSCLVGRAQAVQDERPGLVELEDLPEQLVEAVDDHPPASEHLGEHVVLLASPLGPEHVVEEQAVAVRGGEAPELQPGAVDDGLPEPTDLRVDSEGVHGDSW